MRRITHLVLGAAVTVPIVLDQPIPLAVGCLAAGAIGGGTPDWIDFKTGVRRPFVPRHRGASHGLPVMIGTLALLIVGGLVIRDRGPDWLVQINFLTGAQGQTLLMAFGVGWISHLASDSCTIGGIQPLLPFARWRCWLVPRRLRSRSDGYLDKVVRLSALGTLGFGIVVYAMEWLQR